MWSSIQVTPFREMNLKKSRHTDFVSSMGKLKVTYLLVYLDVSHLS